MEGPSDTPTFSDIHNDHLWQLTPAEGQVTTHEERGQLQTLPEAAPQDLLGPDGIAGRPAAPPKAYLFQTHTPRLGADMAGHPQIHVEGGYGYSESGKRDKLMMAALRAEREALQREAEEDGLIPAAAAAAADDGDGYADDRPPAEVSLRGRLQTASQKVADWLVDATEWVQTRLGLFGSSSDARPRERSPLHAFARHPTRAQFALASERGFEVHAVGRRKSHQVIYKQEAGGWRMNDVRALAWCPAAMSRLAVGCSEGVMVWDIGPKATTGGPQVRMVWKDPTSATLREFPGDPVQAVAWHPSGYLLAAGSAVSSTIRVWDTSRGVSAPVVALSPGGSTQLLKWSPSPGDRLLQTTTSKIIRIWDTRTWTYDQFRADGVCTAACWSYSARVLLLAIEGESLIYSVRVVDRDSDDAQLGSQMYAVFDTRACGVTNPMTGDGLLVGGLIKDLAWDDTNSRLVVSFKENADDDTPRAARCPVAVFNTHMRYMTAHPDLTFGGFVRGPGGARPAVIDFESGNTANNPLTDLSAVLVVGWQWDDRAADEGDVEGIKTYQQCTFQFLPMYFSTPPSVRR